MWLKTMHAEPVCINTINLSVKPLQCHLVADINELFLLDINILVDKSINTKKAINGTAIILLL